MNDELILGNTPLIKKCIKDLNCYWRTDDEWQDLYDAGLLGLINGAREYDPEKSMQSTYLYACIKHEIIKYIIAMGMNKRKIHKIRMVSLDEVVNEEEDETYMNFIEDPNANTEEEAIKNIEYERVLKALSCLTKKQKLIIECRYGLNGKKQLIPPEIAKMFNVSRQAIDSIIWHSIKKLRKELRKEQKMEENSGAKCDYFSNFVKSAISDLKEFRICYVYFDSQVKEIKKRYPDAYVKENGCGFTISLRRKND